DGRDQSPVLEAVERLMEESKGGMTRLNRLGDDMLDASRIKSGKLMLDPQTCTLTDLVRRGIQEPRLCWAERLIHLRLRVRREVQVLADADRIHQVITNYLTNALKHAASDRPVWVQVTAREGRARVAVRDEGPGLPPEEQDLVWERFHQVEAGGEQSHSGTHAGAGLGLGLYISKTIIERHGGEVGVLSSPGKGSTFWFTLPLVGEAT